jgi:hypothetical protein
MDAECVHWVDAFLTSRSESQFQPFRDQIRFDPIEDHFGTY